MTVLAHAEEAITAPEKATEVAWAEPMPEAVPAETRR